MTGYVYRDPARLSRPAPAVARAAGPLAPRAPVPLGLTRRQHEILSHLVEGLSNEDIARRLFLSVDTVKTHLQHLRETLGARDRCHAAAIAVRAGSVPLEQVDPAGLGLRPLTEREKQVLQTLADGCTNAEAGERLGLSPLTVKAHLARIGRVLGVGERTAMVVVALRAGLIR